MSAENELRRIAKVGFGYDITKADRVSLIEAAERIATLEAALDEAKKALEILKICATIKPGDSKKSMADLLESISSIAARAASGAI